MHTPSQPTLSIKANNKSNFSSLERDDVYLTQSNRKRNSNSISHDMLGVPAERDQISREVTLNIQDGEDDNYTNMLPQVVTNFNS